MTNKLQPYTQQFNQTEADHSAQTELPLDSVLLMMARHLVSKRRSSLAHQQLNNAQVVASATAQARQNDQFDN
jgi:hypothetical protein